MRRNYTGWTEQALSSDVTGDRYAPGLYFGARARRFRVVTVRRSAQHHSDFRVGPWHELILSEAPSVFHCEGGFRIYGFRGA